MTRIAIRSHVYRNNIPSKKEHGQIFYSKLHFDLSKTAEQESKAEYYTVKEAMERFNLSRDAVYGVLQFRQIPREKNGHFVRFLKVEFDRVMGSKSSPDSSPREMMQNDLSLTLVCMFSFPTFAVKSVLTIKFSCYARM